METLENALMEGLAFQLSFEGWVPYEEEKSRVDSMSKGTEIGKSCAPLGHFE